jgi:hypothetical protein
MADIFRACLEKAQKNSTYQKRVQQSVEWYKSCVSKTKNSPKSPETASTTQNTSNTTQQNKTTSKDGANEQEKPREEPVIPNITYPRIGWMFNYQYQPKYADTLPYYDLFPITLILEVRGKSFLGLNFHYLSPMDRASFFDLLYRYKTMDEGLQALTINISYSILKSQSNLSYYKPCIKKYLFSHVQGQFNSIPPTQWDIAMFLPTENFRKKSKEYVWEESKRIMGK